MRQRLIPAMTTLVLLLAACAGVGGNDRAFEEVSSDLSGAPTGDATAPDATVASPATIASYGEDSAGAGDEDTRRMGDGGTAPDVASLDTGRDIIYTADVTVAVTDVAAASSKAVQTIQAMGGAGFRAADHRQPTHLHHHFQGPPGRFPDRPRPARLDRRAS